jgi:hypothetical protein
MSDHPLHPHPLPNPEAPGLGTFSEYPETEAGPQLYIGELPSNDIYPPGYVQNSEGVVRQSFIRSADTQFPVSYQEALTPAVVYPANAPAETGTMALAPENLPLVGTAIGPMPGSAHPSDPWVNDPGGRAIPSFLFDVLPGPEDLGVPLGDAQDGTASYTSSSNESSS